MRRLRGSSTLAIALFTTTLAACGSSSTTGTTDLDLTGTWTAIKYQFVSVHHPGTSLDLVTEGYAVTLVGTATAWTVTVIKNGNTFDTEIGTYTSTASSITLTTTNHTNNTSTTFIATLGGLDNIITMTGGAGTFDFGTGNGTEAATLNVTLVR
jgi:hypothetical protein